MDLELNPRGKTHSQFKYECMIEISKNAHKAEKEICELLSDVSGTKVTFDSEASDVFKAIKENNKELSELFLSALKQIK